MRKTGRTSDHTAVIVAVVLALVHSAILLYYARYHMNAAPLFGDEADKIAQAANFFYTRSLQILDGAPYPPLIYFCTFPLYAIFGVGKLTAVSTNILFLAVLAVSLFSIIRHFGKSDWYAVLAFAVVMFFPGVFALSRIYFQDFANIAMVTATFAALLATRNFSNLRATVVFAVVGGLGMLTRGNNMIFWIVPTTFTALEGLVVQRRGAGSESRLRTLRNIVIGAAIGFVIAAMWYLRNYPFVFEFGRSRLTLNANMAHVPWYDPESLLFYLYAMIDYQISPWLFPTILAVSVFALVRKFRSLVPILLWIAVPYIFFCFPQWKLARYTAPILPAFAILFALGIEAVPRKVIRGVLIALVLIPAVVQFAFFSARGSADDVTEFLGNGKLAGFLLRFHMDLAVYQDAEPKPIQDTNFHVDEVGKVLTRLNYPGRQYKLLCFDEQVYFDLPGNVPEVVVECGYFWHYVITINNVNALLIESALLDDGRIVYRRPENLTHVDATPDAADLLVSFGDQPIEQLGLYDKFHRIYEAKMPCCADDMMFFARKSVPVVETGAGP